MTRKFTLPFVLMNILALILSAQDYSTLFSGNTMRVDYFHSGTSGEEHLSLDRVLNDGIWSGSRTVLLDELNLGLYRFEVLDAETGMVIFSRGFCSIFGEWQTTPEASSGWGTFHESVRFPWPVNPVRLLILKRDRENRFTDVWECHIDPDSRFVNPSILNPGYSTWTYMENGPPETKVDILILGDGYTQGEMEKYHDDIERLTGELFKVEPFMSRRSDFNIRAVETPADISGVNRPHSGVFKRSPLSVSFGAFDSERYALTFDNKKVRDIASAVPYDFTIILVNERTYGGGGIYQLYTTVCTDNQFSGYIFIHELGHHMAALADEYYTSAVSYEIEEITSEPWELNITALADPETLKWKDLVSPDTPVPTPWEKEEYDQFSMGIQRERVKLRADHSPEEMMEALFSREREQSSAILHHMQYSGSVGAFEGAGYHQFGLYRPSADCIMFTRNKNDFCPVCQNALNRVINQYTR
ncbi:MAG: hypothetical protein JW861_13885 [Bacteroidales bacterium]|nr:hypothetical protein [Bacteroidales bacterium]